MKKFLIIAISVITVFTPTSISASEKNILEFRDVALLLKDYQIDESLENLAKIATDQNGIHHVFLFINNGNGKLYKDSDLIYDGKWPTCPNEQGITLKMTYDAHVLYAPDCNSLFVDKHIILRDQIYIMMGDTFAYEDGLVTFVSRDAVKQFSLNTKIIKTIYKHPRKIIRQIQVQNNNIAYLVKERFTFEKKEPPLWEDTDLVKWGDVRTFAPVYGLYLNGKKVRSAKELDFYYLSVNSIPYSFLNRDDYYYLLEGTKPIFKGKGEPGMLYEDSSHRIWHSSYQRNVKNQIVSTDLFKNKTRLAKNNFSIPLFPPIDIYLNHYALLGKISDDNSTYRLYSDGKFIGEEFFLDIWERDNNQLLFGKNEKIYMRVKNEKTKKWHATEDGIPLYETGFSDIWLISRTPDNLIVLYGTI